MSPTSSRSRPKRRRSNSAIESTLPRVGVHVKAAAAAAAAAAASQDDHSSKYDRNRRNRNRDKSPVKTNKTSENREVRKSVCVCVFECVLVLQEQTLLSYVLFLFHFI